jgi:ATP-dependent protease HslVU (ClpYQ) peptidase subunit
MTTIATDGHTIAADGRMSSTSGAITNEHFDKLVDMPDGSVIGLAGAATDIIALRAWAEAGAEPENRPKLDKTSEALVLHPGGLVEWFDCAWRPVPQDAPVAIGSGGRFAEGAMLAGASPQEAVVIAARRDTATGGLLSAIEVAK